MASYAVLCGDLAKQAVGKASQTSPRQERMIPTFTRLRDHVYWKEDGQLVGEVTPENIWCALENKWARNTMLGISVSTLLMRGAVRSLGTNVYDRKQMYAVLRQSIGLAETFAALHDEVENATLATIIERRHNTDRVLSGYAGDVMEDFIIIPSDYYAINNWPFGAIAFQNLPHFDAPPDTPTMGCPLRQLDKTRPPSGDRIMDTILASSWNLTAEVYTTIWERGAA